MQGESRIRMASPSFLMNRVNTTASTEITVPNAKLCYEEKSVGSTSFFKCESCPFMAFAEDDIKYHLFTVHPELAKTIGFADVNIQCPGCSETYDAEQPLRSHLREHHKMGVRDVRKMVKSLIQIALKNVKTEVPNDKPVPIMTQADSTNNPEVIEIVPDLEQSNGTVAGVTVISVDELQRMSAVNFQEVDPVEVIQEARINIVYSEEGPNTSTNEESLPNTISDLVTCGETANSLVSYTSPHYDKNDAFVQSSRINTNQQHVVKEGTKCKFADCCVRLISPEKMTYHVTCHQQGKLQCPECKRIYTYVKELHTHLWKHHEIDMELYSCNICNYKTYSLSRLKNIHSKIHETVKSVPCPTCGKLFKNYQQMSTHKVLHSVRSHSCAVCLKSFPTERRLRIHIETVHEKRKPFKCGECDFMTARKCSLQLHSRTHTGETHKCQQCDFSAIDPSSLRRHKQLHSEQKKYNCKHCSYTSIQSQCFLKHMLNQHADIKSDDVFACPYCKFITVNRGKLLSHIVIHKGKDELQHFVIDLNMKQQQNWTKPNEDTSKSWNTPTEVEPITTWTTDCPSKPNWNNVPQNNNLNSWNKTENAQQTLKSGCLNTQEVQNNDCNENPTNLTVPIEVDDCDSEQDHSSYPVNYSYDSNSDMAQDKGYLLPELNTDYNKDDNNSDYIISEDPNDTLNDRHQYFAHTIDNVRNVHNANLREFLSNPETISGNIVENSITNNPTNNFVDNNNMNTSIMSNLPIHLPPNPRLSIRRNLTLTPSDKIPLPVPKATGPIITPSQILPVPSTSNSPISYTITSQPHQNNENEGAPKKKAKISVKSNLILKGPDQINMFETEQNMVFARLQNNERLNMSSPVTFNNLITTCMQLPPEPVLSSNSEDSLNTIPPYTPVPMMSDPTLVPIKDNRLFTFNKQIDINSINMLTQHIPLNKMSIICGNPSFIKLESKQNIQSPSLERMCSADNMLKVQEIPDVYCKSSPLPEDLQKNMNEIKNEIKPDAFYNVPVKSSRSSPNVLDCHRLDTIIGVNEMYGTHLDLSLPLQEITDEDPLPDVIEIDDNSEDNKIIPQRYNLNYPMDYIHNDLYYLENELTQSCGGGKTIPTEPIESNKIPNEVQHQNQTKEGGGFPDDQIANYKNFIHGQVDPMMNASVRLFVSNYMSKAK